MSAGAAAAFPPPLGNPSLAAAAAATGARNVQASGPSVRSNALFRHTKAGERLRPSVSQPLATIISIYAYDNRAAVARAAAAVVGEAERLPLVRALHINIWI